MGSPPAGPPVDTDEARAELERAHCRQAEGHVRRYVRANRTKFLWTLTSAAAVYEWAAINRAWDGFARRLRDRAGRMPLLAVFEPHPGGHGYHVHFATELVLSVEAIRELWGRGHVFVSQPQREKGLLSPRTVARYLAKYLAKSFGADGHRLTAEELHGCEPRPTGGHRYRVAQGFAPAYEDGDFATVEAAEAWLRAAAGAPAEVIPIADPQTGEVDAWLWFWPDRWLPPPPRAREFRRRVPGLAPVGPDG